MEGNRLTSDAYVRHLRADGERFAVAVGSALGARVAACPDWTAADLGHHLGEVHFFFNEVVRRGLLTAEELEAIEPHERVADDQIVAFFREQFEALCTTLDGADPDAPCWSWASEQRVGWVQRRMAQEAAVHRWDAEQAAGDPVAIDTALAIDGIDEFIEYFGDFDPELTAGETVSLVATDGPSWVVRAVDSRLVGDDGQPDAVATGTASDLLLALWRRPVLERINVSGDRDALDRLLNRPKLA